MRTLIGKCEACYSPVFHEPFGSDDLVFKTCKCDRPVLRTTYIWHYWIFPALFRAFLTLSVYLYDELTALYLAFGLLLISWMNQSDEKYIIDRCSVEIEHEIELEKNRLLIGVAVCP